MSIVEAIDRIVGRWAWYGWVHFKHERNTSIHYSHVSVRTSQRWNMQNPWTVRWTPSLNFRPWTCAYWAASCWMRSTCKTGVLSMLIHPLQFVYSKSGQIKQCFILFGFKKKNINPSIFHDITWYKHWMFGILQPPPMPHRIRPWSGPRDAAKGGWSPKTHHSA